SGREGRGRGEEEQPRALERAGAEEDDARAELERLLRSRVEHADGGHAPGLGIEHQLVHDAEGAERELAGRTRGGERDVDAREVRARAAAAMTWAAVVTRGA